MEDKTVLMVACCFACKCILYDIIDENITNTLDVRCNVKHFIYSKFIEPVDLHFIGRNLDLSIS